MHSHDYYDRSGTLYENEVWSCGLKIINKNEDIRIPNGATLQIISGID